MIFFRHAKLNEWFSNLKLSICYLWGLWNKSHIVEFQMPVLWINQSLGEPWAALSEREESFQGTDIYFSYIYGLIVKEAEHLKIQLKWIELKVLPKNLIFIYMFTVDWRERKVKAEKYRQEKDSGMRGIWVVWNYTWAALSCLERSERFPFCLSGKFHAGFWEKWSAVLDQSQC